jgi:hypothetical protein
MSDSQLAKARRGICGLDTLNPQLGVAIISRIACGTSNVSKKRKRKKKNNSWNVLQELQTTANS